MKHVTIIAEAGVNHNGCLKMAKRLIDVAVDAGADYVKFQTFNTERLVTQAAEKAEYQKQNTNPNETQYAALKKLELSYQDHLELMAYCRQAKIGFLSTPFDIKSVDLLVALQVPLIKIPSGEITHLPYLRHVARTGLPVIMSTGMADLSEVEMALKILATAGCSRTCVTVLHCNTEYPTPFKDVNLRAMQTIAKQCHVEVGYSDHTLGIEVPIAAVALGATVIEKHFTLNRQLEGLDHQASLEPDELKAMVTAIRHIESALGDGVKKTSESELKNVSIARKSLVAQRPIFKGQLFGLDNVIAKRPGTGVSPMLWDQLIGMSASRDYQQDELISESELSDDKY